MEIKPKCDMLLDQNRYVGGDPVGHCCFNDAALSDDEYFMCHECAESLRNKEGRVTIPRTGTVKTFQKWMRWFKNDFYKQA